MNNNNVWRELYDIATKFHPQIDTGFKIMKKQNKTHFPQH